VAAVAFIASAAARLTRWITSSPVSRTLRTVSLSCSPAFSPALTISVGGSSQIT
jgi:hypothetical protein